MKYTVVIKFSAEDRGYIATVPDLPGCSAYGENLPVAAEQILPAIKAWKQAAMRAGNHIPKPTT